MLISTSESISREPREHVCRWKYAINPAAPSVALPHLRRHRGFGTRRRPPGRTNLIDRYWAARLELADGL
jgi:hypothetical protein